MDTCFRRAPGVLWRCDGLNPIEWTRGCSESSNFISISSTGVSRNGRHQSPAVKRIRDDFIQDAPSTPENLRWAKPSHILNGLFTQMESVGQPLATASWRKSVKMLISIPFFLIMRETSTGRKFRWLWNYGATFCGGGTAGPLIANSPSANSGVLRNLGRVAEIAVISPVCGRWS